MKVRRMFAGVTAAIAVVGTLAVNAFAADNLLEAEINVGMGWGGELIGAEAFVDAKEGDVVTVEYTINNEDGYHLVLIGSGADGWPTLECSTQAVSDQSDPDFRNQEDGFAVVSVDGSLSYTLTSFDADELYEYGMVIRGYDVAVKSVSLGAAADNSTPEPADTNVPANTDTSANIGGSANSKGNPDTGVEGIAAVAGVAAAAGLAVVLAKKK